jgi:hypothetical protein
MLSYKRFLLEVQQLLLSSDEAIGALKVPSTTVHSVRIISPSDRNFLNGDEVTFGGWDIP